MKNFTLSLKIAAGGLVLLFGADAMAQKTVSAKLSKQAEADQRMNDYLELSGLGYSEKEIFEDLGNAHFLAENFVTAAFWYQKLIDLAGTDAVSPGYMERYKIAMQKAGIADYGKEVAEADWYSRIKEDYQVDEVKTSGDLKPVLAKKEVQSKFSASDWDSALAALKKLAGLSDMESEASESDLRLPGKGYLPPITVSPDRKTAYFSKAIYVKPEYGIFSKKDLVHKIYKAEYINGQWMNVAEVGVCPKYASAMHPAISPDGQRLFFASDMPGSFGKYDIYVADISRDGRVGIAKNLGEKVNTKRNEMYPNLVGSDLLFFASNGREGFGGLDLFAVQVGARKVGLAVNLGAPFNSSHDDFAFSVKPDQGVAVVMSNRGDLSEEARQLVFSVSDTVKSDEALNRKSEFLELLPKDLNSIYTNIYYQD